MNYLRKIQFDFLNDDKSGFLLIEVIVALTLFVSITSIAAGSILTIVNASSQARSSNQAINSITFAIEDMVRNVRLGTTYRCTNGTANQAAFDTPRDCLIGDESRVIIFESKDGIVGDNTDQYIYLQDGDGFYKSVDGLATRVNLLPDGVVMEDLDILVVGSDPDDDLQPRATFIMEFSYDYRGQTIPIHYQTSVTSRTLDVQ